MLKDRAAPAKTPAGNDHADHRQYDAIVSVRPTTEMISRQGLPNFVGVSAETAGARGLCMNMVIIPPGGQALPHYHDGFETAIYLLQGRVETLYGEGLRQSVINEAGDFLFIPPCVPHQPRNLSGTEPAIAIISRNDPKEQESVVLYDPQAPRRQGGNGSK